MQVAEKPDRSSSIEQSQLLEPKNWWKAYALAWLPLGLAYLLVLGVFVDIDGRTLVTTWLANILYPSIVSIGVVWFTLTELVQKKLRLQLIIHTLGAVAYSALWALTLFRLLQLFNGVFNGNWSAPIWPSPVIAWQLFQGLALYFIIVSGTYAYWALAKLKQHGLTLEPEAPAARLYSRSSEGLVPVLVNEISAVRTLDGVTQLMVGAKQLESRLSLSELETLLPSETFVRIHKSVIINLDQVHSVEPAGNGRQSVHLQNGLTFETSRAGAAALKSRFAIV